MLDLSIVLIPTIQANFYLVKNYKKNKSEINSLYPRILNIRIRTAKIFKDNLEEKYYDFSYIIEIADLSRKQGFDYWASMLDELFIIYDDPLSSRLDLLDRILFVITKVRNNYRFDPLPRYKCQDVKEKTEKDIAEAKETPDGFRELLISESGHRYYYYYKACMKKPINYTNYLTAEERQRKK